MIEDQAEPRPLVAEYDRRIEIPFGDRGVTIDARPDQPKWLQAVRDDLHTTHTAASPGHAVDGLTTIVEQLVREVIFIGNTLLIVAPTTVRRDDGMPSVVRVTDYRPGPDSRHHEQKAA